MTTLLACTLTAVLMYSAGWCHGHRTARIRHVPIGAQPADDQAAIELSCACCERWWTSLATDHDPTCPHQQPRSNAA